MSVAPYNSSNDNKSYRGHLFWAPAAQFPSRVFPIFSCPDDQDGNAYLEVGSEDGNKVSGYIRVDPDSLRARFQPESAIGNSWIGAPLRQYVAFSKHDIHEFGSTNQLKQKVMETVLERKTSISSSNPFFGLEIARFAIDEHSEAFFSAAAAGAIANRSVRVARIWAESAPLSDLARESALNAIKEGHSDLEPGDVFESEMYFQTLHLFHLYHRRSSSSMTLKVCEGVTELSNRIWAIEAANRKQRIVVFLTLLDWLDLARLRLPPTPARFHVFARSTGPEREAARSLSAEQVSVHYWSNSMEIDRIIYDVGRAV